MRLLPALVVAATIGTGAASALPKKFTVRDHVQLNRPGAPVVSADGRYAVYTVHKYSVQSNKVAQHLNLLDLDSKTVYPLTAPELGISDSNPVWLDNSTVAFLSARKASAGKPDEGVTAQVWSVSIEESLAGSSDAVKPKQVTSYVLPVESFAYNHASNLIALQFSVYPNSTLAETVARDLAEKQRIDSAREYDDLWVRHWDVWVGPKYSALFLAKLNVTLDRPLDGEPLPLVSSDADGALEAKDFSFSPEGNDLVFAAKKLGHGSAWSTKAPVFTVHSLSVDAPSDKHNVLEILNDDNPGASSAPVYSPDGRYIAWLQMPRFGYESDRNQIVVYDRESGSRTPIATSWDRSPSKLVWTKDSSGLIAVAEDKGHIRAFHIAINLSAGSADHDSVALTPDGAVSSVAVTGHNRFLVLQTSSISPGDFYELAIHSGNRRVSHANAASFERLVQPNENLTAKYGLARPIETWFNAFGKKLHAFIYLPPDADLSGNTKYPSAMIIHGGPQGSFTDSYSWRWNPQLFAAHGYITVVYNPSASTGFGQELTDSINQNWDLGPKEVLEGVKHILNEHPVTSQITDAKRVTGLGASYGGYSINWLNGHVEDGQFACFVNHDGIFSTVGLYYATEELYFPEFDLGGVPWDPKAREVYERVNPANHVAQWNTPTLFIHGALDYRIPDTDALSGFTALRRRGIKSKLLYFPDENHWVTKSGNSVRWYDTVLAWLDENTNNKL
ncbi:alpha/beta-hydrolase [Ramicandelaber brevisporus]|nr:alpha/beta-hydrolase [Ramicandelaber brevisporus]